MTVVCAWCQRLLGTKPPADDSSTTHGICPPCRDRVLATLPRRVHNHGIDPSCREHVIDGVLLGECL